MISFLEALGDVPLELRDGRVFATDLAQISPEIRAFIARHREAILAELHERDRPWWEADGWTVDGWIAELAEVNVGLRLDGERWVLAPRFLYVPPWVASDHHQLEHAGVLQEALRARLGRQQRPEAAEGEEMPGRSHEDGPGAFQVAEVA